MADEMLEGSGWLIKFGGSQCRWPIKIRMVPVQVEDKVAELPGAHSRQDSGNFRYKNLPRSSELLGIAHELIFSGEGILFHIIFSGFHLVPGRVPGLVSLFFWNFVPAPFLGSFWFWLGFRVCLLALQFCSIIISWFRLVLARVPRLVSYLSLPFFFRKGYRSIMNPWFLLILAGVPAVWPPCFSFVSFVRNGAANDFFIFLYCI